MTEITESTYTAAQRAALACQDTTTRHVASISVRADAGYLARPRLQASDREPQALRQLRENQRRQTMARRERRPDNSEPAQ